ncbi:hypothetical protein [Larkinella soli]|uniref:hypothetical protein n=1 Tax=Larkinella soli TaxID=1770527 RepID=UPI000FFC19C1|nr:hypothetical protein [Larkinella soli]
MNRFKTALSVFRPQQVLKKGVQSNRVWSDEAIRKNAIAVKKIDGRGGYSAILQFANNRAR